MASIRLVSGLRAPLRSVSTSRTSIRSTQNSLKFSSLSQSSSSRSNVNLQTSKLVVCGTPSVFKRSFHVSKPMYDIVQFKLADIGEGIAECEILKWHVKAGDKIAQFDLLCEVQSDKATVEITSRYDGVITKLHYNKGDMAKVGSPLVDIEASPEQAKEAAASSHDSHAPKAQAAAAPSTPSSTSSHDKTLTTPAVRHMAARHQIDLKNVQGTGRDGRVLKEDIIKFMKGEAPAPVEKPAPVAPPTPVQISVGTEDRVVPLSGYSRVMVKTMTLANTIPHFGYADEVIVDNLLNFRKDLKKIAESRGIKLTLMPIIIKATSLALKQYPSLNSSFDESKSSMIFKASHNIGVAVDTPNGLIVPNIKNVQNKSIFEIAQDMNRIIQAALKAAVPKEDLSGGTFSLSNIGTIGGTYTSPVIVPPEVAIGAIGKIQRVPRFDSQDRVVPVNIMNISWSADHRVIDGATMANFSNLWKKYLEHPEMMLLDTKIRSVFPEAITIWDTPAILELERNYTLFSCFAQVVDKMGVASAKAQVLNVPITSVNKMLHTDQRLYVHASENTVDGILKVGRKKLFVSNNFGQLKEIEPLCVLDIYVHESKQRSGIGRKLFDYMLQGAAPEKLAYDRPSEKLIGFLAKHFGLKRYAPQANNFVVFKQYWDESVSDKSALMSISQRPLTKNRRVSGVNRTAISGESTASPQKEQKTQPKVVEPRYSPAKPEPTTYYAESYEPIQQAEDQGNYKIVTLPRTSPSKVPGQSATSFENLFPSQSPIQQPPQYKSNLSPLSYKRRDIAEPPNRTTPTKLAAESRGPAISATQRFKHSPVKGKEDPINGVVDPKQTTTMRSTANRTVDALPNVRDELTDIRRQYDNTDGSPQRPSRSSQFQRQFYGKRNIF